MRVALFARYSSRLQDDLSIEAQVGEMERFCQEQGWTITHHYLLPETRSVDVERSDQFQSMLSAARRREFDLLLVHKLDRFGRNRETSVVHKAALRRMGVQVRSVVENLGDGILDRVMEGMLEVFAEFYSHNLAQETKKGQAQMTRRGLWRGGAIPFGLRKVLVSDGAKDHWGVEVDPLTGPIMREVFERVARGERTGDILSWLESKTGDRWSHPTFYTRLKNPAYYGLLQYGRTTMPAGRQRRKGDPEKMVEGRWEGLIPEDLWRAANAAVEARGRGRGAHRSIPRQPYTLSEGVAVCSACGKSLVGNRMYGERYYVCQGRQAGTCTRKGVKADDLEEAFRQLVTEELAQVDLDKMIQNYEKSLAPEIEEKLRREKALKKSLDQVYRKMKNLTLAIAEGGDFHSLREMLGRLHDEEVSIQNEIQACRDEVARMREVNATVIRDHVADLVNILPELEVEDLKTVYRNLFELRFDLEKRAGSLHMRLRGPRPEMLSPENKEEARLDLSRITTGRSARI